MVSIVFRPAEFADIDAMAQIRASEWGSSEYWRERIRGYMTGERNPRKALAARVAIVALQKDQLIALVAGHLTQRYDCDGELQWIDVAQAIRRTGVASQLLRQIATWFAQQGASRVCVDVDPENFGGRAFYVHHGATSLNRHWLVWDDISRLGFPS